MIPVAVLHLIVYVEKQMPSGGQVKPLCKSILTHVVVCGLYGIVSRYSKSQTQIKI